MSGLDFDTAVETAEPEILSDEVIVGIIGCLKCNTFKADKVGIQKTFYELKKEFPRLLGRFAFSVDSGLYFSKRLEAVFSRIQLANILLMDSPRFEVYMIRKSTRNHINEVLSRFNEEDRKDLEQMAKIFEEKFGQEPLI